MSCSIRLSCNFKVWPFQSSKKRRERENCSKESNFNSHPAWIKDITNREFHYQFIWKLCRWSGLFCWLCLCVCFHEKNIWKGLEMTFDSSVDWTMHAMECENLLVAHYCTVNCETAHSSPRLVASLFLKEFPFKWTRWAEWDFSSILLTTYNENCRQCRHHFNASLAIACLAPNSSTATLYLSSIEQFYSISLSFVLSNVSYNRLNCIEDEWETTSTGTLTLRARSCCSWSVL